MSMKRSENERPGLLSRLMAAITRAGKHPSRDTEENPPTRSDSGNTSIGLPGSTWMFGCSAGASTEIAASYDLIEPTDPNSDLPIPLVNSEASLKEENNSSDDPWIYYESDHPDPDQ